MQHEMTGSKNKVRTTGNRSVFVDLESFDRIRNHSPDHINDRIASEIEESVQWYADADPATLSNKIERLDREWDIERAVVLMFAALAGGFLVLQSVTGWSPHAALLRRLRFRTTKEIDAERYALKTLRGDYNKHEQA